MILYYEGTTNKEFLYTNQDYYNEMESIDKVEYDFQPIVEFTLPNNLLDGSSISMTAEAVDIINTDTVATVTFEVPLDNFGARQTELLYMADINTAIYDAFIDESKGQYIPITVAYDSKYFVQYGKTRFNFKTPTTMIVKGYWLCKLLGAIENKVYTSDENDTDCIYSITFDKLFRVNFITTLYVLCPYISKQTSMTKYKKYIIIRRTLDQPPLTFLSIASE